MTTTPIRRYLIALVAALVLAATAGSANSAYASTDRDGPISIVSRHEIRETAGSALTIDLRAAALSAGVAPEVLTGAVPGWCTDLMLTRRCTDTIEDETVTIPAGEAPPEGVRTTKDRRVVWHRDGEPVAFHLLAVDYVPDTQCGLARPDLVARPDTVTLRAGRRTTVDLGANDTVSAAERFERRTNIVDPGSLPRGVRVHQATTSGPITVTISAEYRGDSRLHVSYWLYDGRQCMESDGMFGQQRTVGMLTINVRPAHLLRTGSTTVEVRPGRTVVARPDVRVKSDVSLLKRTSKRGVSLRCAGAACRVRAARSAPTGVVRFPIRLVADDGRRARSVVRVVVRR